jgi:ethanolamine utilization microcompartment shell protein EutS
VTRLVEVVPIIPARYLYLCLGITETTNVIIILATIKDEDATIISVDVRVHDMGAVTIR